MNAIAILKLVASLLPTLIQLIQAVEAAMPAAGQGAQKLALVKNIMTSVDTSLVTAWPALETVIGAIVSVFNATGAFNAKSTPE